MNQTRLQIGQVELLRRRPEVTVTVHVAFQHAVYRGQHCVRADVEFSPRDEQRPLQILLHDRGPVARRRAKVADEAFYFR